MIDRNLSSSHALSSSLTDERDDGIGRVKEGREGGMRLEKVSRAGRDMFIYAQWDGINSYIHLLSSWNYLLQIDDYYENIDFRSTILNFLMVWMTMEINSHCPCINYESSSKRKDGSVHFLLVCSMEKEEEAVLPFSSDVPTLDIANPHLRWLLSPPLFRFTTEVWVRRSHWWIMFDKWVVDSSVFCSLFLWNLLDNEEKCVFLRLWYCS